MTTNKVEIFQLYSYHLHQIPNIIISKGKVMEKVCIFIDGPSAHFMSKNMGFSIDYSRLIALLGEERNILRSHYYTLTTTQSDDDFTPQRPIMDWMRYNGISVISKEMIQLHDAITGLRKNIGSLEVEIASDMFAMSSVCDEIVLITNNTNFIYALEKIKYRGVKVTIITDSTPSGKTLVQSCDQSINLEKISERISRHMKETVSY